MEHPGCSSKMVLSKAVDHYHKSTTLPRIKYRGCGPILQGIKIEPNKLIKLAKICHSISQMHKSLGIDLFRTQGGIEIAPLKDVIP